MAAGLSPFWGDGTELDNAILRRILVRPMGRTLNASSPETAGEAVTLGNNVGAIETLAYAPISVSDTAILVYETVDAAVRQLPWMDRTGRSLHALGKPGEWGPQKIARDGRSVLAGRTSTGADAHPDLWLLHDGAGPIQITSDIRAILSVWSPDGTGVAYVVQVRQNGTGARAELLLKSAGTKHLTDWSRDGRYILFGENNWQTSMDVGARSRADHSRSAVPFPRCAQNGMDFLRSYSRRPAISDESTAGMVELLSDLCHDHWTEI